MDCTTKIIDGIMSSPLLGGTTITLIKYECHLCSFRSDWASSLRTHLKNIHYEPRPKKRIIYTSTVNLSNHNSSYFYCYHCSYKTKKRANLSSHINCHLNIKPFSCDFCAYQTHNSKCWKSHMNKHFGIGMQTCPTCGYSTQSQNDLTKHIRIHTGEKPYVCQVCAFAFSIKSNLIIHMRKHTGDQPYKCNLCAYKTGRKGDLTSHMKSHSNEKPYTCPCGFRTARSGHLKRHLLIHNRNDQPFKCKVCPRKFSRADDKKRHEISHEARERKYPCPQCDFVSFNLKLLKKHSLNVHVEGGESDKHNCPHCRYTSKTWALVNRHINRFHSSIINPEDREKTNSPTKKKIVKNKGFWHLEQKIPKKSKVEEEEELICPVEPLMAAESEGPNTCKEVEEHSVVLAEKPSCAMEGVGEEPKANLKEELSSVAEEVLPLDTVEDKVSSIVEGGYSLIDSTDIILAKDLPCPYSKRSQVAFHLKSGICTAKQGLMSSYQKPYLDGKQPTFPLKESSTFIFVKEEPSYIFFKEETLIEKQS